MTRPAAAQGPTRVLFMHHSCGANLIEQGGVREGLTALGYEFYDHGYNGDGLRLADGSYTGTNFDVPDDNTDPDGYAAIFAQPLHDPPDNTFSHMMQYDVIAFKSCFPTSNIYDDDLLAEYQSYYLSIRDRTDQFPNKIFIIVTQPPQVPNNSDPQEAARARDKWGKQWGDLSNKLGTIVEDLVAPNIPRIAREVFGWSGIADLSIRRKKRKRDRSGRREFDVIAVDEDALIVNETKSTARVDYIDKFVEVLADIFEYFPEHTGKKVIPVFASLYIDESLVQYLTRQGIYAMVLRGDTMEVVNYEEVQKRNRARGKVRDEEQLSEEVI
jgi:hypothetical protein